MPIPVSPIRFYIPKDGGDDDDDDMIPSFSFYGVQPFKIIIR